MKESKCEASATTKAVDEKVGVTWMKSKLLLNSLNTCDSLPSSQKSKTLTIKKRGEGKII